MTLTTPMVDGDPNAPLMIIAMAPGKDEMAEGRPLVGVSGKLLWSCASRAGFSRADCYIVNTIGKPQAGKGGPTVQEFSDWWEDFDTLISAFKGSTVLCLGGDAFWRLTGISTRITDWRGYLISPQHAQQLRRTRAEQTTYARNTPLHKKGDARVIERTTAHAPIIPPSVIHIIPTLHPSGVIRTGFKSMPALAYDIDRAWRAVTGRLQPFRPNLRENALLFGHAPFITPGPVALDIETGRSLVGPDYITLIGIANESSAWSFAWTPLARETLNDALSRATVVVGHNLSFDIPRLLHHGTKIPKHSIYDTMLACQLLQPDMLKGLNWVSSMYLDTTRWKHLSNSNPTYYNAMDAAGALALYHVTSRGLAETGQLSLFNNTIMKALPILMNLSTRGLAVDPIRKEEWRSSLVSQEKELIEEWYSIHPTVSPTSPPQLKKLFYDVLGYPVQLEESKVTVNKTALQHLASITNDPALHLLLKYRRINKMRSSFAEVNLPPDCRIHPTYLPASKDYDLDTGKGIAGTGRIQARDPNIMQQPLEARRMYVPQSADACFIEFDYDQAELRVVAALSGDSNLLQILNSDVHTIHSQRWGCSRQDAKILVYATLYGAREKKLQLVFRQKGIPRSQAQCRELQQRFFADYPQVKVWQELVAATVAAEGRLSNPFGRARYFPDRRDIPAALDFLPQSCVADIVWATLPPLDEALKAVGGHLTTIVHDSFLIEMPTDSVTEANVMTISNVLARELPEIAPGFSLPVSAKVGPTWGDVSTAPTFSLDPDDEDA